ncbi:hypothetical protein [Flectobacillus longus]|uniref:hypothetical protein n=1 Tax=Flectobacillus longus TaxID=2984207 RepID=UPI0024B82F64|nr:hypothetical protein [Flectobacillus longus]MDI9879085.1 hypothetical protein [Flectobacillus longus]
MKIILYGLISIFSLVAPVVGGYKITQQEATRILGESCELTESTSASKNGGHEYKCKFLTKSSTVDSPQRALYFMFESYANDAEAIKMFSEFQKSNQHQSGYEILSSVGEEAFFHSDGKNFCLVIVRKKNEMIRLKVNKFSEKTSITELKAVANDIISRI